MKKIQIILSIAIASLLLTGCSVANKNVEPKKIKKVEEKVVVLKSSNIIPYDNLVNMGQYAEAWIASYKDENGDLFNERLMNFWVKEPSFNTGEEIPTRKNIKRDKKLINFDLNRKSMLSLEKIELDKNVINYLEERK